MRDAAPAHFSFRAQGRSRKAVITLVLVWLGLVWLYLRFDAAPFLLGVVTLFTLPTLWDIIANPGAGTDIGSGDITWFSGQREVRLSLAEIAHVRLDTRLDFAVRATFVLTSGKRLRAPFEAMPPSQRLEEELTARSIRVERHHFSLLG
jgi:hypothetical protein